MAYTTINKGSSYFNTKLYTGTGATNNITGVGFQPDWVWIKQRSSTTWHNLYDVVRGTTKALASNDTGGDDTRATGLTAFTSDGFTLGTDSNANGSSNTYVAWNWLASNTTTANTSGSISSTVSVNTTSGFSVVGYTGNGSSAQTVGHGLGATPKIIFIKRRNSASDWQVGNSNDFTKQLHLNDTTAYTANAGIFSAPNSTTFTIGSNSTVNGSSDTFIAYCFAQIKGFSNFGTYIGNGDANGRFIYTGFKPAFVMTKSFSGYTGYWTNFDSTRSPTNTGNTAALWPNASDAEGDYPLDILSNGFKIRTTTPTLNQSAAGYIYMAFASNPFVTSGGIPVTAR